MIHVSTVRKSCETDILAYVSYLQVFLQSVLVAFVLRALLSHVTFQLRKPDLCVIILFIVVSLFPSLPVGSDERRRRKTKLSLKKKARAEREYGSSGTSQTNVQERDDEVSKTENALDVLEDTEGPDYVDVVSATAEPDVEMMKLGMSGRLRERITRGSSQRNSPYLEEDLSFGAEKQRKNSRKRKHIPDEEGRGSRRKQRKRENKTKRRQAESDDDDEAQFDRKTSRKKRKSALQRRATLGRRTTRARPTVSYTYAEEGNK